MNKQLTTTQIKNVRQVRGNLLSQIRWGQNEQDFRLRLWFDNTKQKNDIAGHLELVAYQSMVEKKNLKNHWKSIS